MTTQLGASEVDERTPEAPLVMYRVLLGGTRDAGNVLRAVESDVAPGAVELRY